MANWYSMSSDKYKSITPEENSLYFLSDTNEIYFGNKSISSIGKIPVLFEGTSIHATETMEENMTLNRRNVEILGQTIQNCLDHSSADKFLMKAPGVDIGEDGYISITGNDTYNVCKIKKDFGIIKPGTQYTLVFDIAENTLQSSVTIITIPDSYFSKAGSPFVPKGTTGIYKVPVTSDNDIFNASFAIGFGTNINVTGVLKFRFAIIEGDWTDKDISWVPFGLNTPQTTEAKMCGKNFIPPNPFGQDSFELQPDGSYKNLKTLNPNETPLTKLNLPWGVCTVSYKVKCPVGKNYRLMIYHSDGTIQSPDIMSTGDYVEAETTSYPGKRMIGIKWGFSSGALREVCYKDLQIEIGDKKTVYEQHTENTVTINNQLGSVSDSVCDRVYLKDGKAYYEQNTKEIVLDGNTSLLNIIEEIPAGFVRASIVTTDKKPGLYNLLCDRLKPAYAYGDDDENIGISGTQIGSLMYFRLPKSALSDVSVESVKEWLASNPIKIRYALDTPITTEIPISDFYSYAGQTNWYTTNDIKPTLKAEFYVDRLVSTADRDAKIDESLSELTENVNELRDLLLSDDEIWTFDRIQYAVQTGRDKNYFSVGDQIKPNWKDGDTVYEDPFDIVQMGRTYELEDGSIINGMMIQQHYANVRDCPFDPQEALYDADEELPAGTYHFTVAGDTWLSSENGKVIQFTLTQPIPAGGQLVYASAEGYNKEIAGQNICTYASPTSFTAIETVALSEGSEGTDLGKTDGKSNLNHHQRAFRGCGRWKTSMLRQYLNSDKPAGEWWTKQDKWDRASTFINSCAGYLAGFDVDFLAIIKPVRVQTARDTIVYDGGTDVTYDMFFPISLEQLNAAPQISGVEGSALDYWKAVAAADTTGNLDSNGRFKQYGTYPDLRVYGLNAKTTARPCWLRSAHRGYSCHAWYVYTSGNVIYYGTALAGYFCAPACVIG